MIKQEIIKSSDKWLWCVLAITWVYWLYLLFNTQMVIKFDAQNYEDAAVVFYNGGWDAFFKQGVGREPLYSFIVSVSMKIADYLSVHYTVIQRAIQLMMLFLTQVLSLYLLRKLKIHQIIIGAVLLYQGFSPALLNAALSLYSEIIVFPAVLLIVIISSTVWARINSVNYWGTFIFSLLFSLVFLWAIFVKAIFIGIFWFFIAIFIVQMLINLFRRNFQGAINGLIFILMAIFCVQTPIVLYKSIHQKVSGRYEFASRGEELFYANVYKRTESVGKEPFFAQVSSIAGTGVCEKFFEVNVCKMTEFHGADYYRSTVLGSVLYKVAPEDQNKHLMDAAVRKIVEHPWKFCGYTLVEALRIFFWESTKIGFVSYPPVLQWLYSQGWFSDGLRLVVCLLTVVSVLWFLAKCSIKDLFANKENELNCIYFFILYFLFSYTSLYSLYSILTRFSLPLGALYLICIAVFLDYYVCKSKALK